MNRLAVAVAMVLAIASLSLSVINWQDTKSNRHTSNDCMAFRVLRPTVDTFPQIGLIAIGEIELCGDKLQWGKTVFGPSMETLIDQLKEENRKLKEQQQGY